jgi:hypothetical protein
MTTRHTRNALDDDGDDKRGSGSRGVPRPLTRTPSERQAARSASGCKCSGSSRRGDPRPFCEVILLFLHL